MSKLFSKLGMGEKTARNFITILLIAAGGAIIYGLPYFRYDYYDAYLEVYHLTNTQMGVFGSIFGVFGMISYLFGGYLADRVSIRLLLTVSLVGTGLGGFLHLLPLTFPMLVGDLLRTDGTEYSVSYEHRREQPQQGQLTMVWAVLGDEAYLYGER